jgi:hypothetical protein
MSEPITINTPPAAVEVLSFGGECPVQGYGTITGPDGVTWCWYFRARWDAWSVSVGHPAEEIKDYVCDWTAPLTAWGDYGMDYAAGYMPKADAIKCITQALALWVAGSRGTVDVGDE